MFTNYWRMKYEWVKEGKDWVRVEKIVNRWTGSEPVEEEIKKPTDNE